MPATAAKPGARRVVGPFADSRWRRPCKQRRRRHPRRNTVQRRTAASQKASGQVRSAAPARRPRCRGRPRSAPGVEVLERLVGMFVQVRASPVPPQRRAVDRTEDAVARAASQVRAGAPLAVHGGRPRGRRARPRRQRRNHDERREMDRDGGAPIAAPATSPHRPAAVEGLQEEADGPVASASAPRRRRRGRCSSASARLAGSRRSRRPAPAQTTAPRCASRAPRRTPARRPPMAATGGQPPSPAASWAVASSAGRPGGAAPRRLPCRRGQNRRRPPDQPGPQAASRTASRPRRAPSSCRCAAPAIRPATTYTPGSRSVVTWAPDDADVEPA